MLGNVYIGMLVLGIIYLLTVGPYLYCAGLTKLANDDFKLSSVDRIMCMIPVVNYFYAHKKYDNVHIVGVSTVLAIITTIAYMFVVFGTTLMIPKIVTIIYLLCIAIWVILYIWSICTIIVRVSGRPILASIVISIVIPFGQYTICNELPNAVQIYETEKGRNVL